MSRHVACSQAKAKKHDDMHLQEVLNIIAKVRYDPQVEKDLAGINYGRGQGVNGTNRLDDFVSAAIAGFILIVQSVIFRKQAND